MSGQAAFKRLTKLAELGEFTRVINMLKEPQDDDRSCYINNVAVIKTATNQKIVAGPFAGMMSGVKALAVKQGQTKVLTKEVMKTLTKPNIVGISLKFREDKSDSGGDDHYFSVFPLDDKTVIVSMGWQKKYNFSEWFYQNDGGRFSTKAFESLLADIEGGDIRAVAGLCSFLGQTRENASIPAALSAEILGYRPLITDVSYAPILG
jgi:hypothetical protein